jgi:hypothetical protein
MSEHAMHAGYNAITRELFSESPLETGYVMELIDDHIF